MLASDTIAAEIISEANIRPTEAVLEIGTGLAALTIIIAKQARLVRTYEIDRSLFNIARSKLSTFQNVEIVCGDAFEVQDLPHFELCVTSLPYSQSLRFLKWAALNSATIHRFLAIVQSEFADKLSAATGTESYRAASVIAQISFDIEKLRTISSIEFVPQPRVMSELIRLVPKLVRDQPFFNKKRFAILNSLFSHRKKTLGAALKRMLPKSVIPSIDTSLLCKRVESLSPDQFRAIIESLEETPHGK